MRFCRPNPRAASIGAACLLLSFGALCLQGCKPSEEPKETSASERLYAELDARFPEGRPGVTPAAKRMEDPDYRQALREATEARVSAANEVARAQEEITRFRAAYAKGMTSPEGVGPTDEALDAALVDHAHYQKLLADAKAAQAKAEEQQVAARETIRERMRREQTEYDTLKAKADAVAKAEGKPIRVREAVASTSTPAAPAVAPVSKTPAEASAPVSSTSVPTAKELAEQLNKPLVETAK